MTLRFCIEPAQTFRDHHRLGLSLTLHHDDPGNLEAARHFLRCLEGTTGANPSAGGHGGRKADTVEAIVDTTVERATNTHRLGEEVAQQGQREIAVGDGAAVRRLGPRPLGVAVTPLAILGHLGKGVDALLRDGEPVADADLLADEAPQFSDVYNALRHTVLAQVDLRAPFRPRLVERTGRPPGSQAPAVQRV